MQDEEEEEKEEEETCCFVTRRVWEVMFYKARIQDYNKSTGRVHCSTAWRATATEFQVQEEEEEEEEKEKEETCTFIRV